MFHFCWSSNCRLYFHLISLKRNDSVISYIFWVKGTVSPGCNLVGGGFSWGSPFFQANLRFVAAISYKFFIVSKEIILISLPMYLTFGYNRVLRGKTGSLPNIRKKGDSFECSLGMDL